MNINNHRKIIGGIGVRILIVNRKIIYTLLIIIIIIIMTVAIYFSFYNRVDETFKMDIYYKGNVDGKVVSFACNIDWGNEYIQPMLETFSEHNIKITFLLPVLGQKTTQIC